MDCTVLSTFRHRLYSCYTRAADALMNACDALLTETGARSFIELSLSPLFSRGWSSLYQAFGNGVIDRTVQRELFVSAAPISEDPYVVNGRVLIGVDASSVYRPLSETSEDRTAQLVHNVPGKRPPVQAGWSFSTVALLPKQTSSWPYILDCLRIPSDRTAGEVAAEQLQAILPLLMNPLPKGVSSLLVGDRFYGSAAFVRLLHNLRDHPDLKDLRGGPVGGLFRIQGHRVFYREPPPPTGHAGHPTWHGPRFKPNDPKTHSDPDAAFEGSDEKGRPIHVNAWDGLHFKKCREVPLRILQVIRPSAAGTKRDPKVSWFIEVDDLLKSKEAPSPETASAPSPLDLEEVPPAYGRRFSLEHLFRYVKGPLMWNQPHLHSPDQFQRWTDIVSAVVNEIVLARDLIPETRRPWEKNSRPATPEQVRRGLSGIIAKLGTPARPCQPRGYSPGRSQGTTKTPALRFPVVHKSAPKRPKASSPSKETAPRAVNSPRSTSSNASPTPPTRSSQWTPPPWLLDALRAKPHFV